MLLRSRAHLFSHMCGCVRACAIDISPASWEYRRLHLPTMRNMMGPWLTSKFNPKLSQPGSVANVVNTSSIISCQYKLRAFPACYHMAGLQTYWLKESAQESRVRPE